MLALNKILLHESAHAAAQPCAAADQTDRDTLTHCWVVEHQLGVILECRNCGSIRAVDPLDMIAKFGSPSATLGMIRAKAVCERCKRRPPYVLIRQPGARGDNSCWPHPSLARE